MATAPITARQFVAVSGDRNASTGNVSVAPAAAGSRALGVAAWDAAAGQLVRVARGGVIKVLAGGAITAGDPVQVGAGGTAVTATTGVVVGQAIASALNGGIAQVAFPA
ncbi:hypothetical protein HMPREF0591_4869 [Mycobacterium parascrofulaceum ATCC BAA-614]|uniref:DUF2190 domain-containing protein n=1 Tax=Mycobacterium parascrofulaceum ATCC BAA-614 TaxID=525368 RepID=D5PFC1_9MYCO|nr:MULTISPECIES: capsid cement protein [Mycobacterium]EFG75191.1 hypothetical protein HMPREF0591_4869 [Mycobacterium parascrofulaceum ATCC BAA-614]